jgi:hypothetical protein
MMRHIIGLFRTAAEAERAVDALQDAGFDRNDFSVVAQEGVVDTDYLDKESDTLTAGEGAAIGAVEGTVIGGLWGLLGGLGALAIPGIGPAIAAGTLATTLGATAAGAGIGAAAGAVTGGLVASLVDLGTTEEDAHLYAEGVKRGGVLIAVHADETRLDTAHAILRQAGAIDAHTQRERWQGQGWQRFDDTAVPDDRYPLF